MENLNERMRVPNEHLNSRKEHPTELPENNPDGNMGIYKDSTESLQEASEAGTGLYDLGAAIGGSQSPILKDENPSGSSPDTNDMFDQV